MNLLKKIVPDSLKKLLKDKMGVPNMFFSFKQMKKLGYKPDLILDIGAYHGSWSLEMSKIFPDSTFTMIEGQLELEEKIACSCKKINNATYKMTLLGAESKKVTFNKYETASSVLTEDNQTNALAEERTLQTLDEVLESNFPATDILLKIDTQGYELEVLKGASKTLLNTNVVLLEVSMLNIYNGAPLVDETILFMRNNGFFLYDICSIIRRPMDNALYQSDFVFVKENILNRNSTRWN